MMSRNGAVRLAGLLLICSIPGAGAAENDGAGSEGWLSDAGHFRVSYSSRLEPIAINRIHSWIIHVETPGGGPVEGAEIEVAGGMPAHDHGLPTSPRVTEYLGDGDYRVEGMRFHMMGHWEIELNIRAGGVSDSVVIPLDL